MEDGGIPFLFLDLTESNICRMIEVCVDSIGMCNFWRDVSMIREGKQAVVSAAKQAETIAPVSACTAGTVMAHTEPVLSAVVLQAECRTAGGTVVPFTETKELSVSRAEEVHTVPCQTETLSARRADYRQGSNDWSLQTLFQR